MLFRAAGGQISGPLSRLPPHGGPRTIRVCGRAVCVRFATRTGPDPSYWACGIYLPDVRLPNVATAASCPGPLTAARGQGGHRRRWGSA